MPCSVVFGTYVRLTLILLRSIQHAVCNFQCFFVGLNLPSDIKHGRNGIGLGSLACHSILRIVFNSFLWPLAKNQSYFFGILRIRVMPFLFS